MNDKKFRALLKEFQDSKKAANSESMRNMYSRAIKLTKDRFKLYGTAKEVIKLDKQAWSSYVRDAEAYLKPIKKDEALKAIWQLAEIAQIQHDILQNHLNLIDSMVLRLVTTDLSPEVFDAIIKSMPSMIFGPVGVPLEIALKLRKLKRMKMQIADEVTRFLELYCGTLDIMLPSTEVMIKELKKSHPGDFDQADIKK